MDILRFYGNDLRLIYMLILVINTATGAGKKRLRKIAKECVNYGQRVQNSIFECSLDGAQLLVLKAKLLEIMDDEKDSLRIYRLGDNYKNKIEHYGVKEGYDAKEALIL